MVLQLWEEIVAGASWETLVRERAPHLVANTFPFFSVDTLEYLRRGGRIGRITALAGTMLSIKPIITFSDDGQLQSIAKVRGRRQVQDKILELLRADVYKRQLRRGAVGLLRPQRRRSPPRPQRDGAPGRGQRGSGHFHPHPALLRCV